jgi:hypothetical protein
MEATIRSLRHSCAWSGNFLTSATHGEGRRFTIDHRFRWIAAIRLVTYRTRCEIHDKKS